MTAPEELLQSWLGERFANLAVETISRPIIVPYDHLAEIDGWLVAVSEESEFAGTTTFPGLRSDSVSPVVRIATAMLIAADYALRRGATSKESINDLLLRESPVAIGHGRTLDDDCRALLEIAASAGIPVVCDQITQASELRTQVDAFALRHAAHAVAIQRRHDPAFTFQSISAEESIGGNTLSSFVLHNQGERDQYVQTGEMSAHVAIEIGLLDDRVAIEHTIELEQLAATIPAFLEGVHSEMDDQSLMIGWRTGDAPSASELGEVLRIWLIGLTGAQGIDLRFAFAPPRGPSPELDTMRARAATWRRHRAATLAGNTDLLDEANRRPFDRGD